MWPGEFSVGKVEDGPLSRADSGHGLPVGSRTLCFRMPSVWVCVHFKEQAALGVSVLSNFYCGHDLYIRFLGWSFEGREGSFSFLLTNV